MLVIGASPSIRLTRYSWYFAKPFKPRYPHTNSPNWSLYISLKNELREFDNRSRYFLLCDHFINSYNLSLDSVWILFGEIWSRSLFGLKGLTSFFVDPVGLLWGSIDSSSHGRCLERGGRKLAGCQGNLALFYEAISLAQLFNLWGSVIVRIIKTCVPSYFHFVQS